MLNLFALPLAIAVLFAFGSVLLLVIERKGTRAGHVFLGAIAVCTVLGLAVAMVRSPTGPFGSAAQATARTTVE